MSKRRGGIAVALLLLVAIGTNPDPARAGERNDPIYGDFNADGERDRVHLGSVQPGRCSAIVEFGEDGGYGPPVAYTYLRPGGDVVGVCPDIGAAFDWDNSPGDELWVGWTSGPPATVGFNRMVLDDTTFHPLATFTSPVTPVFAGTADFVGDGRPTPYAYGRGGFASYVRGDTGGASEGPVTWCSVRPPTSVTLRDFDRNGATDLLLAYVDGCEDSANGVVVVLDDGVVRQLELSPTRERAWTARVVYANDDSHADVRTQERTTGEVSHFISTGGAFVRAPHTTPDAVYPTAYAKTIIDVLANDYATSQARVTITTPPTSGTVQVLSDRRIAYTPRGTPTTDRFVYRITDGDRQSTTSVYVRYRV